MIRKPWRDCCMVGTYGHWLPGDPRARSWKRRPDVGSDQDYPDLSARDAQVVRALRAARQEG